VREQAHVLGDAEGRPGRQAGIVGAGRHPREGLTQRTQPRRHHSQRSAGEEAELFFGLPAMRKKARQHHQHQLVNAVEDFGKLT
jgi:hypothetical protein